MAKKSKKTPGVRADIPETDAEGRPKAPLLSA